MGEHYRADRSATVFSRTIGLFGPKGSCGSVTELLTNDEHFRVCQRCDNRPDGRWGVDHQGEGR